MTEHYEEALTDLDYAIELDPENASAYLSRGQTYYETGHYEEALRDFDYAIKLDPDHKHRSYRWKGQTLQSLGRYQEAIEAFVKAVAALPICKECWGLLTKTCEALYSRSEVPQLLRQVSIPEASTASVIVSRAKAMVDAGYYEEALTDFAQVVVINPDNVETISSRGQAYIKLKRYEEALTDFAHTIELKPQRGKFIFHRAQSYRYLGCYQDALRDFDLASKLDPELKHASQKEKGLVFHAQGKYPKAVDAFTKALIITPICNECWRLLAKTYEASYPRSEIPRLLRSVSIPDASVASVIANRALAMKAIGYYEEALADLERVITLDKALIERYCDDRGLLFSYLKQYDKAIENYEYGLQQKPNDYSDLYNIAVAMTRWKGPTEARVHIDAAYAALRPRQCTDRHGAALYGLGGLEALLGNPDRALDYLQQAILFEEGAAEWARHDIAWLDLRADPRFQALISDDSQWVAYLALKAQSQHSNITLTRQEEAISTKPTLTDSLPVRVVATSSSSMQGDIMYSPIATPLRFVRVADREREL